VKSNVIEAAVDRNVDAASTAISMQFPASPNRRLSQAMNPRESAGRLAVRSFLSGSANETVAEIRDRMTGRRYDCLDLVVVLDADGKYNGTADLRDVMAADPAAALSTTINPLWPKISPVMDQEHAAELAEGSGVTALPVVTSDGMLLGCIPSAALLSVVAQEHREDMHRMVGMLRGNSDAVHALEDPPLQRVKHRLPWLLVGLALSAIAALVMASYEQFLQANVVIAFFIPTVVYLTDAIGTQTETIAVRGLSLRSRPLPRLLWNEMLTGGAIGLILGFLALPAVWIIFQDVLLAAGVGISLVVAGTIASVVGLLMPWSLSRMGIDAAFGSGPIATIVQDVLTIWVYFLVMTALVP
jgi:magnesium transporter